MGTMTVSAEGFLFWVDGMEAAFLRSPDNNNPQNFY